jgi:putative copper resistance protein D
MLEAAVIVVRLLQYTGATVLLGSSLFFVYALPRSGPASAAQAPWAKHLVMSAALLLAASAPLGVAVQASLLAGSFSGGFTVEAIGAVVSSMDLGKAAVVRAIAAASAVLMIIVLPPGHSLWLIAAGLAAIAAASLAWMGHGAATEGALGAIHLASDVVHVLAAGVWIGALACFLLLLADRSPGAAQRMALHAALRRFSGAGSAAVALLVLTGLINGWILVGPQNLAAPMSSLYGRLLALKIALFVAMLALAAINRFRLTPTLGEDPAMATADEVGALRRSVGFETAAALAVLLLVAWIGTLAPPIAG